MEEDENNKNESEEEEDYQINNEKKNIKIIQII